MRTRTDTEYCEACGGRIDLSGDDYASDPDGILICAECAYDERHQKKDPCGEQFSGMPFKPGRPLRAFICGRPEGHPGRHSATLGHSDDAGKFAFVVWRS